jgi:hypothetical protein
MRLEFFIGRWTLPQKHLRSAKLLTRIANRPRETLIKSSLSTGSMDKVVPA